MHVMKVENIRNQLGWYFIFHWYRLSILVLGRLDIKARKQRSNDDWNCNVAHMPSRADPEVGAYVSGKKVADRFGPHSPPPKPEHNILRVQNVWVDLSILKKSLGIEFHRVFEYFWIMQYSPGRGR